MPDLYSVKTYNCRGGSCASVDMHPADSNYRPLRIVRQGDVYEVSTIDADQVAATIESGQLGYCVIDQLFTNLETGKTRQQRMEVPAGFGSCISEVLNKTA